MATPLGHAHPCRSRIKASRGAGEGPALPVGHDATVSTCKMAAHHRQNTAGRRKVQVRARRGRHGSKGARSLAGRASGCRVSGLGGFYGSAVTSLSHSSAAVRAGSAVRPRGLSPASSGRRGGGERPPEAPRGLSCCSLPNGIGFCSPQEAELKQLRSKAQSTGGGKLRPGEPCPQTCFGEFSAATELQILAAAVSAVSGARVGLD